MEVINHMRDMVSRWPLGDIQDSAYHIHTLTTSKSHLFELNGSDQIKSHLHAYTLLEVDPCRKGRRFDYLLSEFSFEQCSEEWL